MKYNFISSIFVCCSCFTPQKKKKLVPIKFLTRWPPLRKTNFAKLNTDALFKAVDVDNSGTIEEEEWIEFWREVKRAGHSEKEIEEEVLSFFIIFQDFQNTLFCYFLIFSFQSLRTSMKDFHGCTLIRCPRIGERRSRWWT